MRNGMKIILNPLGSHGDVRPMLALGLALRDRGHSVKVSAPPNFESLLARYGIPFEPSGIDYQKMLEDKSSGLMGNLARGLISVIPLIREGVTRQFKNMLDVARGADLILYSGLNYAGRSVAEHYEIPFHFVCHSPLIIRSNEYAPFFIPMQKAPRWLNGILWAGTDLTLNRLISRCINENRAKLDLEPIDNFWTHLSENSIISADRDLAPVPRDARVVYRQMGYWHLDEKRELDADLERFIEAGPPPVYIGFGSMTDPSTEKTAEILQGVIDTRRYRLIVSKGWADLGVRRETENVRLVDYVPHAKLFPKMAAVVHHGGAGTIHTAAVAGVPQVVIPHVLDQFYWGKRIEVLHLGPHPVNRRGLTSRNLLSAIDTAIDNAEIRETTRVMSGRLKEVDGLKDAVEYLE